MSSRRGASGLSGILLVDKPAGMTSHDVVNRVRRATGERRVGHAGTLDPMATGLLVVLVGPATRLAPYLTAAEKAYRARVQFGAETDTDDAEGEVVETADVPQQVLDPGFAASRVAALVGVHEQVPPAFSAIKRGGQVAHRAARAGESLELEPRTVEVAAATLAGIVDAPPSWDIDLTVSKGTYVRAVARDLGRDIGSRAHLSALRRTRSGGLCVEDAVTLAEIEATGDPAEVTALFTDPVAALGLPVVHLAEEGALRVSSGQVLDAEAHCEGACPDEGPVAIEYSGVLLGVYSARGGVLKAQTVIAGGVRGGRS